MSALQKFRRLILECRVGKGREGFNAYRSHVHNLGTPFPPSTNTKYEYRITSVTLQASSMAL